MLLCKWLLTVLMFVEMGCVTQQKDWVQLKDKYEDKNLWLKVSVYGGIFYDDDRFRLLSEKPFEKLNYLKSPTGDLIVPPSSDEVISANTRVTIQKIEWPTQRNMIKRPLLTPRHLVWIYLDVARERGMVKMNRDRTYILLVPEYIKSEKELKNWLEQIFSFEDNTSWFLRLNVSQRESILRPTK